MKPHHMQLLYDYNYWANYRILDLSDRLTEAEIRQQGPGNLPSLRDNLLHILGAEWLWRLRCQLGESPTSFPSEADFPTQQALRKRWHEEEHAMRAYLAQLTEEDMTGLVHYKTTRGVAKTDILWHVLFHVVNHGSLHRAEAAASLTNYGHSPGDLDFIVYVRAKREP